MSESWFEDTSAECIERGSRSVRGLVLLLSLLRVTSPAGKDCRGECAGGDSFGGCCCRLHKLQQKHEQRLAVAQRARAAAEDEIAWDDDPRFPSPAASPRPAPATRIGAVAQVGANGCS